MAIKKNRKKKKSKKSNTSGDADLNQAKTRKEKKKSSKKSKDSQKSKKSSGEKNSTKGITKNFNFCLNSKPCFLMRLWIAKVTGGTPPIPSSSFMG